MDKKLAAQNSQQQKPNFSEAKRSQLPNNIVQRLESLPVDNASKRNPGGVEYSNEKRKLAVEIAVNFPELSKKDVAEIVGMKSEANVRSALNAASKGKLKNIDDDLKEKIEEILPKQILDIKNHPDFKALQAKCSELEKQLLEYRIGLKYERRLAYKSGQLGESLED